MSVEHCRNLLSRVTLLFAAVLSLHTHAAYSQQPTASIESAATEATNERLAEHQRARLMMEDALQWAERGWTEAAIKLARRAAAAETSWGPEELSPRQLLDQLQAPTSNAIAKSPTVVAPPAASTTPPQAQPTPSQVQPASYSSNESSPHTRPLQQPIQPEPEAQLRPTHTFEPAAPPTPEIRVVIDSASPRVPAAALTPPAAPNPMPASPQVEPTAAPVSASDNENSPGWRTMAVALFVVVVMLLLRDVRLPSRLLAVRDASTFADEETEERQLSPQLETRTPTRETPRPDPEAKQRKRGEEHSWDEAPDSVTAAEFPRIAENTRELEIESPDSEVSKNPTTTALFEALGRENIMRRRAA